MNIHIETAYKSLNKNKEELCGDKVEIIRTEDSIIMVLADGLGSGVKANILATLTSKIIGTMLREGAKIDEAVETIAQTLPICNVRKLAYSTFSILQLFYDGNAYLAEFDNPSCICVRNKKLYELPFEYRDVHGKNIRECRFRVSNGDIFTLISDGVIHAGVGAVLNLGWSWENVAAYVTESAQNPQSAARMVSSLVDVCNNLYLSKPGDDTTAAMATIIPEQVVHLFSGPPKKKEDDNRLIRDFMGEKGKRIICGGTSANIVSRCLNRQITTSIRYVDPQIPPIATIDGIDLVTEGVLTLSKTVEILKGILSSSNNSTDYFAEIDKENGAAKLAKILLENCTILKLYIGHAINPAHQNPNYPLDLSIKLRILDELSQTLIGLGKRVEKRYY